MIKRALLSAVLLASLSGCGSTPDVTDEVYIPQNDVFEDRSEDAERFIAEMMVDKLVSEVGREETVRVTQGAVVECITDGISDTGSAYRYSCTADLPVLSAKFYITCDGGTEQCYIDSIVQNGVTQ